MLGNHPRAERRSPAGRARGRSSRVGRFGPRSLTARLLTLVLVPMIGLQLLAYREVQRHQDVADSAATMREQVEMLQRSSALIVPLHLEGTATLGLSRAEALGVDRDEVADLTGIAFGTILADARAELDRGLDELQTVDGDVRLPSGARLSDAIAEIRPELAEIRDSFDAGDAQVDDAEALYERLTVLVAEVHSAGLVFPDAATTTPLARIGVESDQLVTSLERATAELRHLAEVGTIGATSDRLLTVVADAGAFDASTAQLRALLEPARRATLDELLASEPFAAVDRMLPVFISAMDDAAANDVDVANDVEARQAVVDVLLASVDRLGHLQTYTAGFLEEEGSRVAAVEADAVRSRNGAIAAMAGALVISLVLLTLLVRSILRPLRQLARQSRQVGDGDLDVAPAKPTGPTDIRVVMRTFNDMVATLHDYDAQVQRLAQGDTEIDHSLPGPLGETLRRSVSHLAEVTQRLHESEAAANEQARTDALTGLANRTRALEYLAEMALEARTNGSRGAVLFLDLDGFKSINDMQGHAEGDRVLAEIGQRLRDACPDHLVARIGGDEFVVLVDHADNVDEIVIFARELIALVSRPCTGADGRLYVLSASAGVALVDGTRDPLAWIAQADSAVYHAKERGRSRVEVYDERLSRVIEERAEMALTMRHALADGQFSIKLQPIIDIASLQPVGAEALLRWNHPEQGEVLPNDFIPVAERSDVIIDLERWVLEQAVNILREWRIDPLTAHLRLAVNISGRHIVEGHLAELIDALCQRAVVDPGLLDLEITETHLVADVGRASSVVDDLREQGIHVAIDDFGTGYSSMSYLHLLTVDTLKIDQVFIAGMGDEGLDQTIVELLLRLGDSMGLSVIAEGVDTAEKLTQLRDLGCRWAQGYYIARPMDVGEATEWLRQRVSVSLASG